MRPFALTFMISMHSMGLTKGLEFSLCERYLLQYVTLYSTLKLVSIGSIGEWFGSHMLNAYSLSLGPVQHVPDLSPTYSHP